MDYIDDERVVECVSCLAHLLNADKPSTSDIVKAVRFLRPAGNDSTNHQRAIRESIRKSILNHPSSGNDGLRRVDNFDNECQKLFEVNRHLVAPSLALLKPLSFHVERRKPLISGQIKHNAPKSAEFTSSTEEIPVHFEKQHFNLPSRQPPAIPSIVPRSLDKNPAHSALGAPLHGDNKKQWNASTELQMLISSNILWCTREVEVKLISDVIFIMQGLNGKHIKYDAKSESYVIDPALKLAVPVKDTVLCLCELGWLYMKVQEYVTSVTSVNSSNYCGLVTQSFGYAIHEEMHDYFRLLSVLEQEAKRSSALTGVHPSGSTAVAVSKSDGGEEASGLTLLRMKAWMQEPIDRMCLIARLVDSARPLSGGALASRLFFYTRHGDPVFCKLVARMMHSVCDPIFHILIRWILHGELNDPHDEFFIGIQTSLGTGASRVPITNVWRDSYFLRPPMLPSFLSLPLAQKVLVIGKSINFIKECVPKLLKEPSEGSSGASKRGSRRSYRAINKAKKLTTGARVVEESLDDSTLAGDRDDMTMASEQPVNDNASVVSAAVGVTSASGASPNKIPTRAQDILSDITTPEIEAALHNLCFGKEQDLTEIVGTISSAIDLRLLRLMENRFHIQTHFSALKKFMLLGQGDFVTGLMDGVGPELKKRASNLFRHNLTGILEGAIRASNAQFEPSYVTDRLGVRLLEAAPGDSGWEIFSLDYSVDLPLNAIVDTEAMAKYRIAFHMLWRLKRVEWTLSIAWKQLTSFTHLNSRELSYHLKVVFHKCTLHRARMMHVVNNLCAFLMFEVMESAWVTLQDTIRNASCLNDVISAHEAYLNEILDKSLLAPQHEDINMLIQQLLQSILRFCNLEETLIADAMASVARKRVALNLIEERTRKGQWGSTGEEAAVPEDKYDGVPVYVIERLEESVTVYNGQFEALMLLLKERGETTGEILKFLTFRLDFNDYHQLQRVGKLTHVEVSPMHAAGGMAKAVTSGIERVKLFSAQENTIE